MGPTGWVVVWYGGHNFDIVEWHPQNWSIYKRFTNYWEAWAVLQKCLAGVEPRHGWDLRRKH